MARSGEILGLRRFFARMRGSFARLASHIYRVYNELCLRMEHYMYGLVANANGSAAIWLSAEIAEFQGILRDLDCEAL